MPIIIAAVLLTSAVQCLSSSVRLARSELPATVVLSKPQPPNVDQITCNGLWKKYGFVCDKEKLKKISETDAEGIRDGVKEFSRAVSSISHSLALIAKHDHYMRPLETVLGALRLPNMIDDLNDANKKNIITANAETCWNYMGKSRSSALCSICSANNGAFYHLGKAAISLHTCNRVLSACDKHLEDLYGIVFVSYCTDKVTMKDRFKNVSTMNIQNLVSGVIYTLIMKPIAEFKERKTEAHAAKLCEALIRIRNMPILRFIVAILDKMSAKISKEITEAFANKPVSTVITSPVPKVTSSPAPKVSRKPIPKASRKPNPFLKVTRKHTLRIVRRPSPKVKRRPTLKITRRPVTQPAPRPAPKVTRRPTPNLGLKVTRNYTPKIARKPSPKVKRRPTHTITRSHTPMATRRPTGKRPKTSKAKSRRLFSQQQNALQSLSDVVVLKPVDGMFASFDGGKGSSLDFSYGGTRPMNLSLSFP